MSDLAALDRISELLDAADGATVNTSMRLPVNLREAAAVSVERLGLAPSTTTLTAAALRSTLETALMQAALDDHYRQHPSARPSLAQVALALAAQDGSPLAERPELIASAAEQVASRYPGADADDVLLWAQAQLVTLAPLAGGPGPGQRSRHRAAERDARQAPGGGGSPAGCGEPASAQRRRRGGGGGYGGTCRSALGPFGPGAAGISRYRIADAALTSAAADVAAEIVARTGVSVADAHTGATIRAGGWADVVVLTSDPGDMRRVAAPVDIRAVRL